MLRTVTALSSGGWEAQFQSLAAAEQDAELGAPELQQLATAAFMVGRYAESQDAWERAHLRLLEDGDAAQACRCLYWLTHAMGEDDVAGMARIGGWLARMERLIEEEQLGAHERAYVQCLLGPEEFGAGRYAESLPLWREIAEVARANADPDIWAFGAQGLGRTFIKLGRVDEGVALFDEVLVALTSGEVSPMMVGTAFCSCVEGCHDAFDLDRARAWTDAVTRWRDDQPDLEAFTGSCLLYRSKILQMQGAWSEAMDAVDEACRKLSEPRVHWELGAAHYQRAELFRLRQELSKAEECYLQASTFGQDPQPGLALLRLSQGRAASALAALERALGETADVPRRVALLAARSEVAVACDDHPSAMADCTELAGLAEDFSSALLRATAGLARGRCLLTAGHPREALQSLRQAHETWGRLEVPYEVARTRVLIAAACEALGDLEGAQLEHTAARETFERLGTREDAGTTDRVSPLTHREVEIVQQVAAGRTNRGIAKELHISEKTVASHLSHIFVKLDLTNRAAVTAYYYEHERGPG